MDKYRSILPSSSNAYTVFDIPEDAMEMVNQNCRPGGYSEVGFIAKDENLMDVCKKDFETLLSLGISCDLIGESLQDLVEKAKNATMDSLENIATVGKFLVSGFRIVTNGYQECPFGGKSNPCHNGRGEITIKNTSSGQEIKFSPLLIYMILYHGFFEGSVSWRLDPNAVISTLELKADSHIKKQKVEEKTWKSCAYYLIQEGIGEILKKHATSIVSISMGNGKSIQAYIGLPCQDPDDLPSDNSKDADDPSLTDTDTTFDITKFLSSDYVVSEPMEKALPKTYCHIVNPYEERFTIADINGIKLTEPVFPSCIQVMELKTQIVEKAVSNQNNNNNTN